MNYVLLIIAFAIIGAGLKYIDCAFDEDVFNKRIAIAIVPVILVVWIYISILDAFAATILFAVLYAVLLSGKVDNVAFLMSAVVLLLILTIMINIIWLPLVALTLFGIMDEKGHDYIDTHRVNNIYIYLFKYRLCMKLCLFCLCACSVFPWIYVIAFLVFDISYETVGFYSNSK